MSNLMIMTFIPTASAITKIQLQKCPCIILRQERKNKMPCSLQAHKPPTSCNCAIALFSYDVTIRNLIFPRQCN